MNRKFYIVFVLLGLNSFAKAQNLIDSIEQYNSKQYHESIEIITDRDIYIVGETVYLQIIKLNAYRHKPENKSKVVYIELLNNENSPVKQIKVLVEENAGAASFRLPDSLNTGNYLLRAYTKWMRNASPDFYFYKNITTINPFKKVSHIQLPTSNKVPERVQFFPEGNSLITNIKSKVAIIAYDKNNLPIESKFILINNVGDTVSRIETDKSGFSNFYLEPMNNLKYFLSPITNTDIKFELPKAKARGAILYVEENIETKSFSVCIKHNIEETDNKTYYLLINSGETIIYAKRVNLNNDTAFIFTHKNLPIGTSQFVLTTDNKEIISERWINIEKEIIQPGLRQNKPKFSTREKVKLNIDFKSFNSDKTDCYASISVTKKALVNNNYIRDFLYDNQDQTVTTKRAQTQFAAFTPPKYTPELKNSIITGSIKNSSGDPLKNTDVCLAIAGNYANCQITRTNNNGAFNFETGFFGYQDLVIQNLYNDIKDYYIELEPAYSLEYNSNRPTPYFIDTTILQDLNRSIVNMQINAVYKSNDHKITEQRQTLSSSFYEHPEDTYYLDDYIEFNSLKEITKEIILSVSIKQQNSKESVLKMNDKLHSGEFKNGPFLLIDGIPVKYSNDILNIDIKKIDRIEVINRNYFLGGYKLEGILHIITKEANLSEVNLSPSIFHQMYEGYSSNRDFYSPDYNNIEKQESRIPDYRNTLYWNPQLNIDKSGQCSVEFFTSDDKGEYTIQIKGIGSNGEIVNFRMPLIVE